MTCRLLIGLVYVRLGPQPYSVLCPLQDIHVDGIFWGATFILVKFGVYMMGTVSGRGGKKKSLKRE